MPKCEEKHLEKRAGRTVVTPHFYIAGNCIHAVTLGARCFLEATFPYYKSSNYEKSHIPDFGMTEEEKSAKVVISGSNNG